MIYSFGMHTKITSYSRYILVVLCVSVVFTTIALIALNAAFQQRNFGSKLQLSSSGSTDNDLQMAFGSGYQAARQNLMDKGLLIGELDPKYLTGVVTKNDDSGLFVMQTSLDSVPAVDGVEDERQIIISPTTKFYSETSKSSEDFARELEAYAKISLTENSNPAPLPVIKKAATLTDIKVGDKVKILSEQSVRFAPLIQATQINILPQ